MPPPPPPPPPIGFSLFSLPDYLSETWAGTARISHTVNGISRGPKGTVRATAIAAEGMDTGDQIGCTYEEQNIQYDGDTKEDERGRRVRISRQVDII
ncbi:MAG: hypothetical protein ACRYGK_11730 [Janthinobacterium lividum]